MRLICRLSGHSALFAVALLVAIVLPLPCAETQQQTLNVESRTKLEAALRKALLKDGAPAAQVAIVRDGDLLYTGALGKASLEPSTEATPQMPFRIGSVSKQFTAAAVMVLVEQGKLRLDDPVFTWFPELGHAHEVTLRNLLNQVSGYSDDYTEDYLTPEMAAPIDPYALIKEWTAKPLDFAPGTRWQYSNTNYGLAALIVQKVSGEPFFAFLQRSILTPAGLTHAIDLDGPDVPAIPQGYVRYGFGPLRPAMQEGKGTVFGAGELAMPVEDLARWNLIVLKHKLLKPESWQTMESEVALPNGKSSGYGMGFFLGARAGHRVLEHSGEVNGFVSDNTLYPAEGVSITILTNAEGSTDALQKAVESFVFTPQARKAGESNPTLESLISTAVAQLQQGKLDRANLAPNLNFFFTPQVIADYKTSLASLGKIKSVEGAAGEERGGMRSYFYKVHGTGNSVGVFLYVTAEGKLDQLILEKLN